MILILKDTNYLQKEFGKEHVLEIEAGGKNKVCNAAYYKMKLLESEEFVKGINEKYQKEKEQSLKQDHEASLRRKNLFNFELLNDNIVVLMGLLEDISFSNFSKARAVGILLELQSKEINVPLEDVVYRYLSKIISNLDFCTRTKKFGESFCKILLENGKTYPFFVTLRQEIERIKNEKPNNYLDLCQGVDERFNKMISSSSYKRELFLSDEGVYHSVNCKEFEERKRCDNCTSMRNKLACAESKM